MRYICCANPETLSFFLQHTPAGVVCVRAVPFDNAFPRDAERLLQEHGLRLDLAVASYPAYTALRGPCHHQGLMVFSHGTLVGLVDPEDGTREERWERMLSPDLRAEHRQRLLAQLLWYARLAVAARERRLGAGSKVQDPFSELGLSPGASLAEARLAHRKIAAAYHPDAFAARWPRLQGAAEDILKRANVALDVLQQERDAS